MHSWCSSPTTVESLGWSYPAEFSQEGIRVLHRAGIFRACFPEKILSGNQLGGMLWYIVTSWGVGGNSISPVNSVCTTPGKGKNCSTPTHRLLGTTPTRRLFGSVLPSFEHPRLLSSVLWGEGRAAGSWDIQSVSASEAIGWDWDKVLSALLKAGLASPQMGDSCGLSS